MNIYVPLGLLLALLCLFSSKSKNSAGKMFAFCMLIAFVFSAIRYEFGPDYFHYWAIYERGEQGRSLSSYWAARDEVRLEPVFRFYIQLFPKYTLFIVTNTLLWFGTIYLLFKKYVDLKYGWLIILFLFFNINCMINNYVAMRTSLAAVCFIPGFFFLTQNKRWLYLLFVLLGSMFHESTIVLALLVFLNGKKDFLSNNGFIILSGVLALAVLVAGENFITTTLSAFAMESIEDMNRYANYMSRVSGASLTFNALVFKILTFIPALYLAFAARKETDTVYIYIYKIGIISALLLLLLGQNILTDRFLMILNPFYILAVIHSFRYFKPEYNVIVMLSVFVVSFYMFYNTMNSSYAASYQVYHTIFGAPYIP